MHVSVLIVCDAFSLYSMSKLWSWSWIFLVSRWSGKIWPHKIHAYVLSLPVWGNWGLWTRWRLWGTLELPEFICSIFGSGDFILAKKHRLCHIWQFNVSGSFSGVTLCLTRVFWSVLDMQVVLFVNFLCMWRLFGFTLIHFFRSYSLHYMCVWVCVCYNYCSLLHSGKYLFCTSGLRCFMGLAPRMWLSPLTTSC